VTWETFKLIYHLLTSIIQDSSHKPNGKREVSSNTKLTTKKKWLAILSLGRDSLEWFIVN